MLLGHGPHLLLNYSVIRAEELVSNANIRYYHAPFGFPELVSVDYPIQVLILKFLTGVIHG